ncbi:unnamed protein product [Periconia digitata]|uniref:Kynureninase n=1 Tax=Periconia digitata TaxID=1303443 RepID=A0A9W4U287_9PLEO|nr:unnamed protein product [Periconia digitata]
MIYLVGSGIGLQPKNIMTRTSSFLNHWASQGMLAAFSSSPDPECPTWLDAEQLVARLMAPIVGARDDEVAMMGSLTANLHYLLATFYRPHEGGGCRTRIIIEEGVFNSDLYAVQSHVAWHGLEPAVEIIPVARNRHDFLSTQAILETIDAHSNTAALLLLSGVQFDTGQLLEIPQITAYARERSILVGWDLAHAVGNVELRLHDWNVDFAVWCSYKYLNAGPGATGGLFLHGKHGTSEVNPRLSGWWGMPVSQRFTLQKQYVPNAGASRFQLSSPSILDITAVTASLVIFEKAGMRAIVEKSIKLTGYLETLLDSLENPGLSAWPLWTIITPRDIKYRGAMLSLRWYEPECLERVVGYLKVRGVLVDVRKPDIMRITPAPLYNTFEEINHFVEELRRAVAEA